MFIFKLLFSAYFLTESAPQVNVVLKLFIVTYIMVFLNIIDILEIFYTCAINVPILFLIIIDISGIFYTYAINLPIFMCGVIYITILW